MIRILKASAGSGKTYNLAKEYIRLILESEEADAYRHTLAVTFTNKATDEMKQRILKELYTLAKDPSQSPYTEDLAKETGHSVPALQKRAQQQLSGILHDYSAFAVSTIDKFFQQTLRAFSREIGQFSSYQVQLDRDQLVEESVDRVLDNLAEEKDKILLDWLTRSVREDLQQTGRFFLDGRLKDMAKSLRELPEGAEPDFPKEKLEKIRPLCKSIVSAFTERVQSAAQACLDALDGAGVSPQDSKGGFLKQLYKYQQPAPVVPMPTAAFLKNAADPDAWFAKSKASLKDLLHGALDAPLQRFVDCFGLPYKEYNTARTILGQLYGLGVAGELREAFTQIQKEKNVLSLDDSNTILRGIIDGTDAPFIYEKLGVRFENFLLDEFQDTALIQWENFRPLLSNSNAAGGKSLVVGDVKQSIYRWRGSDWELLGSRLEKEFPDTSTRKLEENFRTCRSIVEFNNEFFAYAAGELDRITGAEGAISALYADVEQQVRFPDPAPGSVEVRFTDEQMEEILSTLDEVRARGGQWADVAILVRGNDDGSAIAAELVGRGIPVVSDDSLYVKTSITVRRLVSQLALVDAPPKEDAPTVAGYLARSLGMEIPSRYHSLVDLAEQLLRDLKQAYPAVFDAEVPYIQSFMDYLADWVSTGGNNLGAFLRDWEEAKPKIASPRTGNAVRVMTIHKSKGLEFPFVIVPFAEQVTLYKGSPRWCRPAVEGSALEENAAGIYQVSLDSGAAHSLFEADYYRERILQAVDNINVFYVALTRAKYGLKIIATLPPKNLEEPKNLSQVLYTYVGALSYTKGEPYWLGGLKRENDSASLLPAHYASFPADSGGRLRLSPEAADYFGEDGSVGAQASRRIRGTVLHEILSRVAVPEDLPAAVDAAVLSGDLPADAREDTLSLLGSRIESVRERGWFSPDARILQEVPILSPDGEEHRPDRVILGKDGSAVIVDYKFGAPKEGYKWQIRRYVNLYKKMGYQKVEGYLWYLEDNLITFVS